MLRKFTAAALLALLIMQTAFTTALADNGTPAVIIQEGEQSDNVILLQMRLQDLGYYNYKVTGFFGSFTKKALQDFQKQNGLTSDGVAGEKTLDLMYGNNAKRAKIVDKNPPPKPKPAKHPKYGQYLDWFKVVQYKWTRGMACKVVDFDTNISYTMVRVGGIYHSDSAPLTKADNANFIKSYKSNGGSYPSWDRRAVEVDIPGLGWVAASTNGYPHGSTGIVGDGMTNPNGSKAQICIHFLNSRCHCDNLIDPAHQYEIKRAAGIAVGAKPPALATE